LHGGSLDLTIKVTLKDLVFFIYLHLCKEKVFIFIYFLDISLHEAFFA